MNDNVMHIHTSKFNGYYKLWIVILNFIDTLAEVLYVIKAL